MSAMKFYVSASILAIPIAAAINTAIPNGGPIVVHNLTYADGRITQDRTVTAPGDDTIVLMAWGAQIVDADTGTPVAGCTGSGTWPYQAGRVAAEMSVQRWVGSDACVLDAGTYYPVSVYTHADGQVEARGAVFEVTE